MKTHRMSLVLTLSACIVLGLLATACGSAEGQDPTSAAGSDLNSGSGSGGGSGGGTIDAGVPTPPPPGPGCTSGGLGNAKGVCSADTAMLTSAEATCEQEKSLLHTFSPDEKCGKGSSSSATFTCCPSSPPPPPPPPPPVCTKGGFANANGVCSPDATLEAAASADCAKQNLALTSFVGDEKCGKGSSSSGTYTCCAGPMPL